MKLTSKILIAGLALAAFFTMGFSQADLPLYYALAVIAFVVAVSFLVRYPQWGIYLIALLFPFTYLELVYSDLNVPYVDVIALLLFIVSAVINFLGKVLINKFSVK